MARSPVRPPYAVPAGLRAQAGLGPDWADWLERLPGLLAGLMGEWQLDYDGEPGHGFVSLVAPVRTTTGEPAVLKISFDGDDESLHEGLTLQHWGGHGTVRLLRADPRRRALLLERLHTSDLTGMDDRAACEVVAGLYPRVHLPALPQLRALTSYLRTWNDDLARLGHDASLPPRLVEQGLSLAEDLITDRSSTGVIIHGDLHYENVLAADREPWLVIDPKPMSGDPHYEPAPLLWNRWEEMVATGDLRGALRRRFHTLVDTAGLDEDRARDWVVVRAMHNASWTVADARRAGSFSGQDRDWLTAMVATAKAVQG